MEISIFATCLVGHRLKLQYQRPDTDHLWRQSRGLVYAHYDIWIPEPMVPNPCVSTEEQILSINAYSDENWGNQM